MEGLTIGRLAREAGVNSETIRFYERRGLIPKPPRPATGYRRYPPETVRRVRFIRHAKELGFSLKEILELLSLRLDPETTCIRENLDSCFGGMPPERKVMGLYRHFPPL